ncbi:MAG: NAD-binding protein [Candidatus Wallbacteria bacterium]|nr:NAD-binding protein [Candidatus Wallbacteria bacterium]
MSARPGTVWSPTARAVHLVVRAIRARLRFYAVLLREFWLALAIFGSVVSLGGLALVTYHEALQGHSFLEGVWTALALMLMQAPVPFSSAWQVQILFFLLPFLGIALVAEQVIRFCILVFNKENRLEDWYVALASTYGKHYIVCGLGNIGYRVVKYLKRLGKDVVVLELRADGEFVKEVQDRDIPVVIGDARRADLLVSAGIERAEAILAVTDNDLANLEIAMDARQINPDVRVVLRMFDDSLASKVKKAFNIQVAFSSSGLAGPAFAAASTSTAVRQSYTVREDIYHVAELTVGSGFEGKTVHDLQHQYPCSVLAVVRGDDRQSFPPPGRLLARGDLLIAAAALETITAMESAV